MLKLMSKKIVTILSSNSLFISKSVDNKCYHEFTNRVERSVDLGRYFQAHLETGKMCGS